MNLFVRSAINILKTNLDSYWITCYQFNLIFMQIMYQTHSNNVSM